MDSMIASIADSDEILHIITYFGPHCLLIAHLCGAEHK